MKCSAYIAASADGFIARADGGLDWLETAGKPENGMGDGYIDFATYLESVDCMVMGRKTMEKVSGFDLPSERWPYGTMKIVVPSSTVAVPPDNLKDKVEMYSGDLPALLDKLEAEGFRNVYVDGGATIQTFIELRLLDEIIITQLPVLIGEGKPLFGKTSRDVNLADPRAVVCPSGYIQIRYRIENDLPNS